MVTIEQKICQKCKVEKPIDSFGIRKATEDGHNPVCLECRRDYFRKRRIKQAKKTRIPGSKPKTDTEKIQEPAQKKTTVQHEESAEAQLIMAFKKTTIKSFIKDDLIPMLERAIEERFA